MNKTRPISALILLGLLAACSSAPEQRNPRMADPKIEAMIAKKRTEKEAIEARFKDPQRIRLDIDKSIDSYFKSLSETRTTTNTRRLEALDRVIREKTLQNFDMLLLDAGNADDRAYRGIALAALGFAEEPTRIRANNANANKASRNYQEAALNPLVSALSDPDDYIVNQALVGLAIQGAQNTPTQSIGNIVEDSSNPLPLRKQATWTLLKLQPRLIKDKQQRILPIWIRILSQPIGEVDAQIVVQSLRGLGLFRREQDAAITAPYLEHPVPLVRIAACIALGRQNHQESWEKLVKLLEPTETNDNVRLAARKALATLAGGKDRKYDVKAWRQQFQRK